jgi:hypothetical protein
MIVAAAGGQRRPRYVRGIPVAVLIVAAYALVGIRTAALAPTPTVAPSVVSVVVAAPLPTRIPVQVISVGPPVFGTPAPAGGIERGGKPRPMPRP